MSNWGLGWQFLYSFLRHRAAWRSRREGSCWRMKRSKESLLLHGLPRWGLPLRHAPGLRPPSPRPINMAPGRWVRQTCSKPECDTAFFLWLMKYDLFRTWYGGRLRNGVVMALAVVAVVTYSLLLMQRHTELKKKDMKISRNESWSLSCEIENFLSFLGRSVIRRRWECSRRSWVRREGNKLSCSWTTTGRSHPLSKIQTELSCPRRFVTQSMLIRFLVIDIYVESVRSKHSRHYPFFCILTMMHLVWSDERSCRGHCQMFSHSHC